MLRDDAVEYINSNYGFSIPFLYSKSIKDSDVFKTLCADRDRLEKEFIEDEDDEDQDQHKKHNQIIGIMCYMVRINLIIFQYFTGRKRYLYLTKKRLENYEGDLAVLLQTIEDIYYSYYDESKRFIDKNYIDLHQNRSKDDNYTKKIVFGQIIYPKKKKRLNDDNEPFDDVIDQNKSKIKMKYYVKDTTGLASDLDYMIETSESKSSNLDTINNKQFDSDKIDFFDETRQYEDSDDERFYKNIRDHLLFRKQHNI